LARTKAFDREEVLDRAMRVFWRKGYDATSIQDLIDAMGIGRQSLYDTFGDKQTLYLAALDRYGATAGARLLEPLRAGGLVKPALHQIFANVIEESIRGPRWGCFITNAAVERAPCDPETAQRVAASFRDGDALLRRALEQGQAAGEIESHRDPCALAHYLANAIHGLRVTAKATTDRETLQEIAAVTLSVLD
jgi:TetR/AcrR family transcriptional regulator, transcriptional repressor for nem operon